LKDFEHERDAMLDELLRHEGLGTQSFPTTCPTCNMHPAELSCTDCTFAKLECASCICEQHAREPLHRIQRWNGTHFVRCNLASLGLIVQLGHDGVDCASPSTTVQALTLIDITGIHKINIRFCECVPSPRTYVQLLRARWWPATFERPQTAVTIRTLRLFHALTVQAKVNAYDFHNALIRMTDGSSTQLPKGRYHEFSRVFRFYRHLQMVKRGGRGHNEAGINATSLGELAIECLRCPQPGRNLPANWESAPAHLHRFLYTVFLSMDANFKLKLKNHKYQDIELAPGWAYFVEESLYQAYLATHEDEDEEIKDCDSTFAAIDHANMPSSKRFCINGVGAVVCARHSFFRASGVADLPAGERYSSMTYILLSTIRILLSRWRRLIISYDIACQFCKNFLKRMRNFPVEFQVEVTNKEIIFIIPKFHLPAHGASCQVRYSFNFIEGVGRTHGEGIEANWSETNGAALSTREMSFAARHETLNDFFGAMNWRKTVSTGSQLASSLVEASDMVKKQEKNFSDMKQPFPDNVIDRWDTMIEAWDLDKRKPNPYEEPVNETKLADVQLELSRQETRELQQGAVSLHEMTASTFLNIGIQLQEQQRVVQHRDGNKDDSTARKKVTLQEARNVLQHRIKNWRIVQAVYMPVVSTLIHEAELSNPSNTTSASTPEFEKLWMPSDVPSHLQRTGLASGLVEKEKRLREAECEEALHEIRRFIRIRMGLRHYKSVHVDGPSQKRNTRARTIIQNFTAKRDRQFDRYKAARSALDALDPDPQANWRTRLLPMQYKDMVDPSGDDEDKAEVKGKKGKRQAALGEGRREVPWIWCVPQSLTGSIPNQDVMSAEEIHESMRATYAKSRARVRRWNEEVLLLLEEMRRSVAFLQWKASLWFSRANGRSSAPPDIQSGIHAYALRQAEIHQALSQSFINRWNPLLIKLNLSVEWPTGTLPSSNNTQQDLDSGLGGDENEGSIGEDHDEGDDEGEDNGEANDGDDGDGDSDDDDDDQSSVQSVYMASDEEL
ncbi:hypothetical protein DENSPDRAFT_789779, partial [Dentipellis sp. KUC8613]